MNILNIIRLGRTEYKQCWEIQKKLHRLRAEGAIGDLLLLTEHDPVYTIGKTADENHLLAGVNELQERGVAVHQTDRGGDITYHGPGQIVGYPILDLHGYYLDLHRYLRDLEAVIIRTLARYGAKGTRMPEYTGVWVGNDKICAIGIKTSRWVTMHGFAINVATDLSHFGRIIPCGIFEKGITSLREVLGMEIKLEEVSAVLVREFGEVFGVDVRESSLNEILLSTGTLVTTHAEQSIPSL